MVNSPLPPSLNLHECSIMNSKSSFMHSPLVTWAQTLLDTNCRDFKDLFDGPRLQQAWLQIDPHPAHPLEVSTPTAGGNAECIRLKHLSSLLSNIRSFYENVLDQSLVLPLPDVVNISLNCNQDMVVSLTQDSPLYNLLASYAPDSFTSDMQTFLLLMLGCAVQCDQKQVFIEQIKKLDISIQHSIVECIQQITDNPDSVFLVSEWGQPPEDEDEKNRLYAAFVHQISRLTKERDQLYERVVDLTCELLNLVSSPSPCELSGGTALSSSNSSLNGTSPPTAATTATRTTTAPLSHCDHKSHYLVELAEIKSKLRRVQQELEEKCEIVVELKEIIEQSKESCNKLRHDNLQLTQEARSAKAYRDEIDVLLERVRKMERLEAEVVKYRDKMNELEYCKTRIEEIREDNRILGETKTMLEEQLEASRKRSEKVPDLEEKILKLNAYSNEINLQRQLDRNQIERLVEEVAHLQQEKKTANDELCKVQLELSDLRTQIRLNNEESWSHVKNASAEEGNLFDQMKQDTSKRVIKLEHENQKLQNLMEDYHSNYVDIDSLVSLFSNFDCFPTISKANEDCKDGGYCSNKSKAEKLNDIKEFADKLRLNQSSIKTLDNQKQQLEKEVLECKTRVQEMDGKLDSLERSHISLNAENQKHLRMLEQKNMKLEQVQSELAEIEAQNLKLVASADSLRLSLKKLNDLEMEMTNLEGDNHKIEQDKKSLEKEIGRFKTSIEYKDKFIDQMAAKVAGLELSNKLLKKDIENSNTINNRLKELEKEVKELASQVNMHKSTTTTLQQSLVEEKLRSQRYVDQLHKIVESMNKLSGEYCLNEAMHISAEDMSDNLSKLVDGCVRNIAAKCAAHNDSQLALLQVQMNDMQTLIDSLRSCQHLDRNTSLNQLQHTIIELEEESRALRSQLAQQRELQLELSAKNESIESKLGVANERNAEINNDNAQLEVENSLLKSQNAMLETHMQELQTQMAEMNESISKLRVQCNDYDCAHKQLISDNESLQELHQQLTADYDALTSNHTLLKQSYKALRTQNITLQDEMKLLLAKHDKFVLDANQELKNITEKREQDQAEESAYKQKLDILSQEHKTIIEESKRIKTEHKMLQNIYKNLRAENNELKLKHTDLQGETAECKDRMNGLNVEVCKLANYCEMVALTNNTLETQRKKLATQSASLLAQYNDLLMQLSTNCPKAVIDKLSDLCIKKERLEKMFKEYDLSIEKNMPKKCRALNDLNAQFGTEAIYEKIWDDQDKRSSYGETGNIVSANNILRQYSESPCRESSSSSSSTPPPRIPPRNHTYRQSVHLSDSKLLQQAYQQCNDMKSAKEPSHLVARMQIMSTVPNKSASPNTPPPSNAFMRGLFKSSSVNYGNHMVRRTTPIIEQQLTASPLVPRPIQQTGVITPARKYLVAHHQHHPTSLVVNAHRSYQTSPSGHHTTTTDLVSLSHTHEEQENDSEGNVLTRSRITISNNCIEMANEDACGNNNSTIQNGGGSGNINIQISNVINNNADSTGNVDNANNANASNSIWYEYGCV